MVVVRVKVKVKIRVKLSHYSRGQSLRDSSSLKLPDFKTIGT